MTDNEIIKALECCRDNDNNLNMEKCFDVCPYDGACAGKFMQDVLSLVNRQKGEIERLKGWENLLKAEKHSLVKAAAIKEFAYRLRQRSYESSDWSHGEHPMVVEWSDIDEVLKEMAGENNA